MRSLLLLSIFCLSFSTYADVKQGVIKELGKFTAGGVTLPEDYKQSFPEIMQQKLLKESQAGQNATLGCYDNTKVEYIKQLTQSENSAVKDFEAGFVRIEVAKCFSNSTPQRMLSVMSSVEYKKRAFKHVASTEIKSPSVFCEKSETVKGKSSYCVAHYQEQVGANYIRSGSINYWNESQAPFLLEIFFRQTLLSLRQVGGDVQLHTVTYMRVPKFNSFEKLFADKLISMTQNTAFEVLNEMK